MDFICPITALGVSPQYLPLCWLADFLLCPPPVEICWKCKRIYIHTGKVWAVITLLAIIKSLGICMHCTFQLTKNGETH